MWRRRSALLIACLALAIPAVARPSLRGGATTTLTMSVERLPPGAEEWEAFLSLDGGAHYPIRVTPHLDLAIRCVTWVVPNVDASDARILIRAGDERHETSFPLPESFAIERDATAAPPPMRAAPPAPAEAGVVAWAEGDRAGTRVALVTNTPPPSGVDSVRAGAAVDGALFEVPQKTITVPPATSIDIAVRKARHRPTPPPRSSDVLLFTTRMNI